MSGGNAVDVGWSGAVSRRGGWLRVLRIGGEAGDASQTYKCDGHADRLVWEKFGFHDLICMLAIQTVNQFNNTLTYLLRKTFIGSM